MRRTRKSFRWQKSVLRSEAHSEDDPLTQSTIGETTARIAACRAYALSAADTAWQEVCETGEMSDQNRANLRLAITFVHQECVQVVEQLYAIAGSAALYTKRSRLDRHLRDMHAMNQHVVLGASNYAAAGRVLARPGTAGRRSGRRRCSRPEDGVSPVPVPAPAPGPARGGCLKSAGNSQYSSFPPSRE